MAVKRKGRPEHFDRLETRAPRARERALLRALPGLLSHAKRRAPGWTRILQGIDPRKVKTRKALAALPVTRKSELLELQKALPPLGGLNATPIDGLSKLFISPGSIHEPEGRGRDWWRTARGLFAGGFRPGDVVVNAFAYHFTPAGSMLESGALALGCTVVPTGTGQTEMQVAAIAHLRASGYIGTPSFLKLIVEKADELKADISSLKRAQVGAEYLPPELRRSLAERGIAVTQMYGTADLGLLAYESLSPLGAVNEGMILEEGILLEIVRPGSGEPVPAGEVGEVVVTSFNRDYPLIRFATGDLSAVLPGTSPCGRTNTRIRGWMGRADQSTKVRGLFVTPAQVNEVMRRHPEIARARLVVAGEAGSDRMTLKCEVQGKPPTLGEAIVGTIRDVTKLRGEVELVQPGTLPNDGKVIEDTRKYA
ncbi:MAG: AMP-binding protein [Betaproteobacteria bacterium]|nr:AMP-binding protein [Betaproteobacteria bacterium]